jgi:hypothetical protein
MPCTRVADRAMPWAHSLDGGPSSVSRNLSVPPSAERHAKVDSCYSWLGVLTRPRYSDAPVANRNVKVRHGTTENGP